MSVLRIVSIASLILSTVSAFIIVVDILTGHRQKMAIMNWVWPVTGVWAGPLGLWAYYNFGRASGQPEPKREKPFPQITAVGDLHCAAGCTLGDFAGEWVVFLTGFVLAGSVLWSDYLTDFILAYAAGI